MSEDASDFFFFGSGGDKEDSDNNNNNSVSAAADRPLLPEFGGAAAATARNETLSSSGIPSVAEVLDIADTLTNLVGDAPKALAALKQHNASASSSSSLLSSSRQKQQQQGSNRDGDQNATADVRLLASISSIELRRQQQVIADWSGRVVEPLARAVVRWEEEVVRHADSIKTAAVAAKASDRDRNVLDSAIESGNAAVRSYWMRQFGRQLQAVVGERRRELRLSEDLLALGMDQHSATLAPSTTQLFASPDNASSDDLLFLSKSGIPSSPSSLLPPGSPDLPLQPSKLGGTTKKASSNTGGDQQQQHWSFFESSKWVADIRKAQSEMQDRIMFPPSEIEPVVLGTNQSPTVMMSSLSSVAPLASSSSPPEAAAAAAVSMKRRQSTNWWESKTRQQVAQQQQMKNNNNINNSMACIVKAYQKGSCRTGCYFSSPAARAARKKKNLDSDEFVLFPPKYVGCRYEDPVRRKKRRAWSQKRRIQREKEANKILAEVLGGASPIISSASPASRTPPAAASAGSAATTAMITARPALTATTAQTAMSAAPRLYPHQYAPSELNSFASRKVNAGDRVTLDEQAYYRRYLAGESDDDEYFGFEDFSDDDIETAEEKKQTEEARRHDQEVAEKLGGRSVISIGSKLKPALYNKGGGDDDDDENNNYGYLHDDDDEVINLRKSPRNSPRANSNSPPPHGGATQDLLRAWNNYTFTSQESMASSAAKIPFKPKMMEMILQAPNAAEARKAILIEQNKGTGSL